MDNCFCYYNRLETSYLLAFWHFCECNCPFKVSVTCCMLFRLHRVHTHLVFWSILGQVLYAMSCVSLLYELMIIQFITQISFWALSVVYLLQIYCMGK